MLPSEKGSPQEFVGFENSWPDSGHRCLVELQIARQQPMPNAEEGGAGKKRVVGTHDTF